jgi:GT2 family glycosyltransferase
MKKLVSVIIVNWNGKKYLKECCSSLRSQNYPNIEIIIVDNGSIDGSVNYVRKHYPNIKIIKNNKNLGYAGGNNVGYNAAKGEYILFLNNDTKVTKSFLTNLVKVLESSDRIGVVQSKILLMDMPERIDSIGSFLTPTGFLYHFGVQKKDVSKYNVQMPIYSAKGACALFRRDVLKKVEVDETIFDERFFCYFEETDLAHRIWLAGYKILYVPSSVIFHKLGATSVSLDNEFVQFHSFKNRISSYLKNFGASQLILILPLHLLICEFFSLTSLLSKNFKLFFAIQRAIWWNVTQIKNTLRLRKIVQSTIRRESDEVIKKYIYRYPPFNYYRNIKDLSKYED